MRVLAIGDVFGTLGLEALRTYLPELKQEYKPHLIFVNGENIDKGFGITEEIYKELMTMGIALVTMGNHTFRNSKILDFIDGANILRPANYDDRVPGVGFKTIRYNDKTVTVVNLMGRVFMGDPLDNPFKWIDAFLQTDQSDFVFIDFHAEATSEKIAFALHVDGRVTAVYGTHTHVPTADAMILPQGTMYVTDVGMTGAKYGVLGAEADRQIEKFITGMRGSVKEQKDGPRQLHAVLFDTDIHKIQPIHIYE